MSFRDDAMFLRNSRLHQILGQLSLRLLRLANTLRPMVFGISCTVVSDDTQQILTFCDNFAHSATPINEVCLEQL